VGEAVREIRVLLTALLRERRGDLEAAVATRVRAIDDPAAVTDPAYAEGQMRALVAAVEYSLAPLEGGERRPPSMPAEILAQARLDARDGVPLYTVTRRYLAVEHAREARNLPTSAAERRRECVKRLLAGELVDEGELGYDLDAEHVGLMAKGDAAKEILREVAARLDRKLLAVRREEEPIWAAWLGGRRPMSAAAAVKADRFDARRQSRLGHRG
jgi:hypothetical protein